MQPSDSSSPSASALVPLALAYLDADAILHVSLDAPADGRDSGTGHRLPAWPAFFKERRGLPGSWAVLVARAASQSPRRVLPLLPYVGGSAVAFGGAHPLGTRENRCFRGCHAAAHAPAYLRIADPVAEVVARLASEWSGLTLSGGVRTRRTTNRISESYRITSSFRTSLSWSQRAPNGLTDRVKTRSCAQGEARGGVILDVFRRRATKPCAQIRVFTTGVNPFAALAGLDRKSVV